MIEWFREKLLPHKKNQDAMGLVKIALIAIASFGILLGIVAWGRGEVAAPALAVQRHSFDDDASPRLRDEAHPTHEPAQGGSAPDLTQANKNAHTSSANDNVRAQHRTPSDILLSHCPVRLPLELHPSSVMRSMLFFGPATPTVPQAYAGLPACPEGGAQMDAHEADTNEDQRASHIHAKYRFYASRCNLTGGIMWAHMTASVMQEVTRRVSTLAIALSAERASKESLPRVFSVLDWASGCGAGAPMLRGAMREAFGIAQSSMVDVLGVELIDDAVAHARRNFGAKGIVFCQADGTKLQWVREGQFDIAVSFGGLLHLPSAVMCDTISQLLRKLKPNGMLWTGYVDNPHTADALARCADVTNRSAFSLCPEFSEPTDDATPLPVYPSRSTDGDGQPFIGTHVFMLRENMWFKNIGMPRVYRRKKPLSIVWRKIGW